MLPLPTLLALSLWSTAALQPGVGGYRPMLAAPRVPPTHLARRALLGASSTALSASLASQLASPAAALIKGSTPPAQGSRPKERKCTNIDECEALAAKREQEITAASGSEQAYDRTVGGDRYRNQVEGSGASASLNDSVSFRYRVMRLGKRSSDGLSGEAQTIFSLGYGEDEDKEGDLISGRLLAGEAQTELVPGVRDALIGMREGGKRRVLVRPERGWKDQSSKCADIVFKADIGAEVEQVEACMDKTRLPQPRNFQARRRMARRFDESLLVEIELAKVNK